MGTPDPSEIDQSWSLEDQVRASLSQVSPAGLGRAILLHQAAWAFAMLVFFLVLAFADRGSWILTAAILTMAAVTIPAARHELRQRRRLPAGASTQERRSTFWTHGLGVVFLALAIYVLVVEHSVTEPIGAWSALLYLTAVLALLPRSIFGASLVKHS